MSKNRIIYHSYFTPNKSTYNSILFQDSQAWRLKGNVSMNIFNRARNQMERECRLTPLSLLPGAMSGIVEGMRKFRASIKLSGE